MAKNYHGEKKSMKGMGKPPSELIMKDYPNPVSQGPMGVRDDIESIDMLSKSANKKIMKNKGGRFSESGRSY